MEHLAGQFHVVACDMSGSGKSPAFSQRIKYTLDDEVAFLVAYSRLRETLSISSAIPSVGL
jgi:hypothetical protein